MEEITTQPAKTAREAIGFRISPLIKERLVTAARKQNVEPSDVYRRVFNEGLRSVYGYKIEGNELVE